MNNDDDDWAGLPISNLSTCFGTLIIAIVVGQQVSLNFFMLFFFNLGIHKFSEVSFSATLTRTRRCFADKCRVSLRADMLDCTFMLNKLDL